MISETTIEQDSEYTNNRRSFSSRLPFNEENRRILPTMLSLLFLITLLIPRLTGGKAEEFTQICPLTQFPTVYLQVDDEGIFKMANSTNLLNTKNNGNVTTTITIGTSNSTNNNPFSDFSSVDFIPAKQCSCASAPSIFCLLENGDTCGVPRDPNSPVGCFFFDSRAVFVKNAWPVVLLWYGGKSKKYSCFSLIHSNCAKTSRFLSVMSASFSSPYISCCN